MHPFRKSIASILSHARYGTTFTIIDRTWGEMGSALVGTLYARFAATCSQSNMSPEAHSKSSEKARDRANPCRSGVKS